MFIPTSGSSLKALHRSETLRPKQCNPYRGVTLLQGMPCWGVSQLTSLRTVSQTRFGPNVIEKKRSLYSAEVHTPQSAIPTLQR